MRVLCCGGSLDGQWRELTNDVHWFRALKPSEFNWRKGAKVETEHEYEEYVVSFINILGFGMKVASLRGAADEGVSVLKALVQRDVFEHIVNPGRKRGG